MDNKDKKILGTLITDARQSITRIAKKAGVSREVALYRMNNLNKGIIRGYYTTINLSALGFRRYGCLMQFSGITIEEEERLIRDIAAFPFISFVGPQIGKWNVAFDIHAQSDTHLKEILDGIKTRIGMHLTNFLITNPGANYQYFPHKYLGEKEPKKPVQKEESYRPDKIDKKILSLLAKDSRIGYVALAQHTKLSANAIKYRIRNLEKTGIISGYTISLDFTQLGFQFYNIQLELDTTPNKKFLAYLAAHPRIMYYYHYLGQENWDMDIGVIVKDVRELRNVLVGIRKDFGDTVKIYNIMMNPDIIKDDIAPEGVFQ